ncbi:hypothetical protein J3R83DRAFT_8852, partial [Lanmaoa asiatica]
PKQAYGNATLQQPSNSPWSANVAQNAFLYQPETLGNEFSVLTDFLETLNDGSFTSPQTVTPSLMSAPSYPDPTADNVGSTYVTQPPTTTEPSRGTTTEPHAAPQESTPPHLPSASSKTEKLLLTAAVQESASGDERLNRVIRSKYSPGLLKPYDYVKGYLRSPFEMDGPRDGWTTSRFVSRQSKQQTLQPLSVLRPKFRDLVFIEETSEHLLLDYDRVFSAMGVPACLWRRTGEIYKGNCEFTELVGVDGYMMRD